MARCPMFIRSEQTKVHKFLLNSDRLGTLKYENIVLMSSSNPKSIILSASSSDRYLKEAGGE